MAVVLGSFALARPAAAESTCTGQRRMASGRSYLLWRPASAARGVLVLLHGYGSSPERLAEQSGLPAVAVARGYAVVAPRGSGQPARWGLPGRLDGPDDVAFVDQVLRDVAACGVRVGRPVVAGFSNGAALAAMVACHRPVAGLALVAGAGITERCVSSAPTLVVQSDDDTVMRAAGGPLLGGRLTARPLDEVVGELRSERRVKVVRLAKAGHTWPTQATSEVVRALR